MQIAPGLWHWSAPHPDWSPWNPEKRTGFGWSREVGCVRYETREELVLIDPLTPPPCTAVQQLFWHTLDNAVRHRQQPVTILLSTDWHDRSAQAVYDRYSGECGASIWIHEAMPQQELGCKPTRTFREGDTLPATVQVYVLTSPHPEVLFYLPPARALVVADALWGTPDGRIWIGSHEFCMLLPKLLKTLLIDTLLLSHAAPIISYAHEVLAKVVAERPEWTEGSSIDTP